MDQQITFVDDVRSLHKPAWDSRCLGLSARKVDFSGIEGKHVFLRTRKAIFENALVTKETRETIFVRYVKKSHADKSKVVKTSESIKKADILVCRRYKES